MKKNGLNLIIDFDSTFVKLEALDELAGIALSGNKDREKILDEIKKTTVLGMEGKITFPVSLARRFRLLPAHKKHVAKLIKHLRKNISDSVKKNKKFFIDNNKNIYIISGGFEEYIYPVIRDYGIRRKNIISNKFVFDTNGNIIGFDRSRALAKKRGKVSAVKNKKIKGEIWVIGDGYTDYEIKKSGVAQKFIAYCENVKRDVVCQKADCIAKDFNEVIKFFGCD